MGWTKAGEIKIGWDIEEIGWDIEEIGREIEEIGLGRGMIKIGALKLSRSHFSGIKGSSDPDEFL